MGVADPVTRAQDHRRATAHLRRADPVLSRIIARLGPCRLEGDPDGNRFAALAESIFYQQITGKAAASIHRRFLALYPGVDYPTTEQVLRTPPAKLRGAGLSTAKVKYLRDLAQRVAEGEVDLKRIHRLPDEAVVENLITVKGIGEWTAQMFLIFHLGRPDVLPTGDYGLRKAVQREYRQPALPSARQLTALAEPWRPHRTVATWYLWQSTEPIIFGTRDKDGP